MYLQSSHLDIFLANNPIILFFPLGYDKKISFILVGPGTAAPTAPWLIHPCTKATSRDYITKGEMVYIFTSIQS